MSTPNHELPQPTYVNPRAIVESVFPGHGADRDRTSQRRMAEYLKQRLLPRMIGERAVTVVVPDGIKTKHTVRRDGWLISPKTALAGTLIGLGILNGTGNTNEIAHNAKTFAQDVGDEIDQAAFWLKHGSGRPDVVTTYPDVYHHSTIETKLGGDTRFDVGDATVDPGSIAGIVASIEVDPLYNDGGKITSINVESRTSDEVRTDDSLGRLDDSNRALGERRSLSDTAALKSALEEAGVVHPEITVSNQEMTLTADQKSELTALAERYGFSDVQTAIRRYDAGQDLPEDLHAIIEDLIATQRGSTVTVNIEKQVSHKDPGYTEVEPGIHPPDNPNREYEDLDLYPFLIPPLPRLRLQRRRVALGKEVTFMERGTPAWIRLYKEALNEDGQLKKDLTWYTRKMNHLLRDDRIQAVDVATVTGNDGAERSMRTCFVDHTPSEDTLQRFRKVTEVFARANEGALADSISTIMIYPTSSAGVQHDDPKKIGLGIDEQYESSTLGTTTPLLGLIEMHMPDNPTDDDMRRFMGALWIYAHEMTHGVDVNPGKPQKLIPLLDGRYVSVNTWRDAAGSVHQQLLPVERNDTSGEVRFRIQRELRDRDGKVQRVTEEVDSSDPRLAEAVDSQIIDRMPTQYGSTVSFEHFAEAGAAITTGIDIPYGEAGVRVVLPAGYNFASGYRPAQQSEEAFFDASGISEVDIKAPNNRVQFNMTTVDDDKVLQEIARRARTTEVPREEDMIEVLGWVVD